MANGECVFGVEMLNVLRMHEFYAYNMWHMTRIISVFSASATYVDKRNAAFAIRSHA